MRNGMMRLRGKREWVDFKRRGGYLTSIYYLVVMSLMEASVLQVTSGNAPYHR